MKLISFGCYGSIDEITGITRVLAASLDDSKLWATSDLENEDSSDAMPVADGVADEELSQSLDEIARKLDERVRLVRPSSMVDGRRECTRSCLLTHCNKLDCTRTRMIAGGAHIPCPPFPFHSTHPCVYRWWRF